MKLMHISQFSFQVTCSCILQVSENNNFPAHLRTIQYALKCIANIYCDCNDKVVPGPNSTAQIKLQNDAEIFNSII